MERRGISSLLSTHSPVNKQGHLGNLKSKSRRELLDLIQRQENILSNKKFVSSLPDKGRKLEEFLENLREVFNNLYEKDAPQSTVVKHSRMEVDDIMMSEMDELKIVEKNLTNLAIHEGPHYDVIKQAETKPRRTSKFKEKKSRTETQQSNNGTTKSNKPKDLTSASYKDPSHGTAQIISIDESRNIILDRNKRRYELELERAGELMANSMDGFFSAFETNEETQMADEEEETNLDDID